MFRILLQYLLPLTLPALIYLAYIAIARGGKIDRLGQAPWLQLTIAGVALLVVSLVAWGLTTGSPPEEVYVPPRFEDGRVVPSTTVQPEAQ
jgi:Family of unknown function (DUF6111)